MAFREMLITLLLVVATLVLVWVFAPRRLEELEADVYSPGEDPSAAKRATVYKLPSQSADLIVLGGAAAVCVLWAVFLLRGGEQNEMLRDMRKAQAFIMVIAAVAIGVATLVKTARNDLVRMQSLEHGEVYMAEGGSDQGLVWLGRIALIILLIFTIFWTLGKAESALDIAPVGGNAVQVRREEGGGDGAGNLAGLAAIGGAALLAGAGGGGGAGQGEGEGEGQGQGQAYARPLDVHREFRRMMDRADPLRIHMDRFFSQSLTPAQWRAALDLEGDEAGARTLLRGLAGLIRVAGMAGGSDEERERMMATPLEDLVTPQAVFNLPEEMQKRAIVMALVSFVRNPPSPEPEQVILDKLGVVRQVEDRLMDAGVAFPEDYRRLVLQILLFLAGNSAMRHSYVSTLLTDSAGAYDRGPAWSCTKGMLERLFTQFVEALLFVCCEGQGPRPCAPRFMELCEMARDVLRLPSSVSNGLISAAIMAWAQEPEGGSVSYAAMTPDARRQSLVAFLMRRFAPADMVSPQRAREFEAYFTAKLRDSAEFAINWDCIDKMDAVTDPEDCERGSGEGRGEVGRGGEGLGEVGRGGEGRGEVGRGGEGLGEVGRGGEGEQRAEMGGGGDGEREAAEVGGRGGDGEREEAEVGGEGEREEAEVDGGGEGEQEEAEVGGEGERAEAEVGGEDEQA